MCTDAWKLTFERKVRQKHLARGGGVRGEFRSGIDIRLLEFLARDPAHHQEPLLIEHADERVEPRLAGEPLQDWLRNPAEVH